MSKFDKVEKRISESGIEPPSPEQMRAWKEWKDKKEADRMLKPEGTWTQLDLSSSGKTKEEITKEIDRLEEIVRTYVSVKKGRTARASISFLQKWLAYNFS